MANITQCGVRKSFVSIKNKHPLSPSIVYPIAIVSDFWSLNSEFSCFMLWMSATESRSMKMSEATQKDVFHFSLWHEYFARVFLSSGVAVNAPHVVI